MSIINKHKFRLQKDKGVIKTINYDVFSNLKRLVITTYINKVLIIYNYLGV